jgi:hypothetical protein
MVGDGLVEVAFACDEHWPQLEALAVRYADMSPDLAERAASPASRTAGPRYALGDS